MKKESATYRLISPTLRIPREYIASHLRDLRPVSEQYKFPESNKIKKSTISFPSSSPSFSFGYQVVLDCFLPTGFARRYVELACLVIVDAASAVQRTLPWCSSHISVAFRPLTSYY